ncbi:MAG: hypothetical protein IJG68_02280 [Bacilli bacterium]|nr:hypothetical protein [Bacilli bacterium]
MLFDYDTLVLLRKNTKLNPINLIKISNERTKAVEYQQFFNKVENAQLGVDYSVAEQLEAELRFKVWKKIVLPYWIKFSNGIELDEYALDLLYRQKEKEKNYTLKRKY